jgi:hypothetical protein
LPIEALIQSPASAATALSDRKLTRCSGSLSQTQSADSCVRSRNFASLAASCCAIARIAVMSCTMPARRTTLPLRSVSARATLRTQICTAPCFANRYSMRSSRPCLIARRWAVCQRAWSSGCTQMKNAFGDGGAWLGSMPNTRNAPSLQKKRSSAMS